MFPGVPSTTWTLVFIFISAAAFEFCPCPEERGGGSRGLGGGERVARWSRKGRPKDVSPGAMCSHGSIRVAAVWEQRIRCLSSAAREEGAPCHPRRLEMALCQWHSSGH